MSAAAEPAAQPETTAPGLRRGCLGLAETLGQSIANIAPTATPVLTIAVIAGIAGVGTWLAFLIATIGMIFVAANIATLARRYPMAGSYFVYIGRTLGPLAGMIAGWSMVAAYLAGGVASVIGGQVVLGSLLQVLGLGRFEPPGWAVDALVLALVWALAHRDIRLSSRVGVIIECLSVSVILVIAATILLRHRTAIDPQQFDLRHLGWGGVMSGLALAVFSFVGFESAATLAKEARDPTRAVPRAIFVSAIFAGLFFVATAYVMVLGVDGQTRILADSPAPFAELTGRAGLASAAVFVYLAALSTVVAAALACVNAASRLLFSMGRYAFVHSALGAVHDRHQTPHRAIATAVLLIAVVCLAMLGLKPLDGFGLSATFSTFGFLIVYLLISVVAPVDLHRAGLVRRHHLIIGAVGALLMAFVIVGSLYPVPDPPYNLLPYLFAGYLIAGGMWYAVVVFRRPHTVDGLQQDLEL